jgi:uncharacterized protein YozE (UPF0346 family)
VAGGATVIVASKRVSFHEFLAAYRSPLPSGDEIADLASDVLGDPQAPKRNTRLVDYLNRRGIDADLINMAVKVWKEGRNG